MNANDILTSTSKFHITLGLDRIKAILKILNNPQNDYKVIHIAGTNGKGSTSKIINEFLINHFQNKKRIGLFTSPHIFNYTERIKINNVDIKENDFDSLVNEVENLAKKNNIELSEFELITAVAFYYFSKNKVDFVVLEVGLGGRFDATNVIDNPIMTVITTIDFDHTERLGKTIEEISSNKAGIIKNNCKVVVSKDNSGYTTILKTAKEKNAKIIEPLEIKTFFKNNQNYAIINNQTYEFNLNGQYQSQNLSLAYAAIKEILSDISNETIKKSLKKVTWKFRLEFDKNKNLIIDCAHNPQGIQSVKTFLDNNFKDTKKTYIFGCLKNKDHKKMMEIITKNDKVSKFYFYEFNYPNALKYDDIDNKFKNIFEKIDNPNQILLKDNNLKIVLGSIYMLSKIF